MADEFHRKVTLISCLIVLIWLSSGVSASSQWVDIFNTFKSWNGTYNYSFHTYPCSVTVNSADPDTGVFTTFTDGDANFEMSGHFYGNDDLRVRIIFSMTRLVKSSSHFSPDNELQIVGYLSRKSGYDGWTFLGNATKPENNFFRGFNFSADNGKISPASAYPPVNESLRVGLTIGLSLTCAFIGVAAMVAITIWAIRKGYLRHVQTSYENFKNPKPAYRAKDDSLHI
ncbi:uncharacterized protein [Argopecten irradians]|uniref:uncharacterized protein n=1 Tax=Argopecten irradians TaxID=31199 RepID=UPI00371C6755